MSTLKVNEVRHLSNSGTANVVLESNATTNLQATSTLGLTVTGTLTVSGVSTFNGNVVIGNAITDTVDLQSKVTGFNNFSGFTGEIRMYAGNAAGDAPPTGWLYCNGDTISSTSGNGGTHYNADGKGNDYQPLFNLLKASSDWGNSSGATWGATTVKTPDFRSRAPVGIHTGAATSITAGLTSRTLSDAVGTETHALTIAQLAAHTHASTIVANSTGVTTNAHTHTSAAHTHTSAAHTHAQTIHSHASAAHVHTMPTHIHTMPSHTHSVPSGTSGSTTPSATGSTTPSATGSVGDHNHTLYLNNNSGSSATQQYGLGSGWGGSWGQTWTAATNINPAGAHSHTSAAHTHTSAAHTHTTPGSTTGSTDPGDTNATDPGDTNSTTPGSTGNSGATATGSTTPAATGSTTPAVTGSTQPNMTDPSHNHVLTAASTGSGTAHTILSPIIAVNYIIKV